MLHLSNIRAKIIFAATLMTFVINPSSGVLNGQVSNVFSRQGGDTPQGVFRMTSGGYEVYSIACADKSFQPASLFYGENEIDRTKVDALAPSGQVPTSMNCFIVNAARRYMMFDAGLPASKGGKTLERMKSTGIVPAMIEHIFITHVHFDHIGGLLDDNGKDVFKKATLYINHDEWEFFKKTMGDNCRQIEAAYSGRIVKFHSGEILPDNVLPIAAPGHTPGHTAFRVGNLLFVGDIMHGVSIQMVDPTVNAGFDADKAMSVETRNKILNYAVSNSLTVFGAHAHGNGVLF